MPFIRKRRQRIRSPYFHQPTGVPQDSATSSRSMQNTPARVYERTVGYGMLFLVAVILFAYYVFPGRWMYQVNSAGVRYQVDRLSHQKERAPNPRYSPE